MDIVIYSADEEEAFASGDLEQWLALVEQDESPAPDEQAASTHQAENKTDDAGPVTPPTPDAEIDGLIEQIKHELEHMEV